MFVITGVTGHTGKVAAETLLAKGEKIRVVVRTADKGAPWAARGAEVAIADVNDTAALTKAFAGAKGAFVLLPPDLGVVDYVGTRKAMVASVSRAVTESKLPHVVLLSSIGAQHAAGTGPIAAMYGAEKALAATGRPFTAVRAAYFLENFGSVLPAAEKDGVLPSFLPANHAIDVVATADIGRAVAQALLDGPRGNRVIELSGPKAVSPSDAAAALTKILGRPVKVHEAPVSAMAQTLISMGIGATMAKLFQEMNEGLISRHVAFEGKGERQHGTIGLEEGLRGLLGK